MAKVTVEDLMFQMYLATSEANRNREQRERQKIEHENNSYELASVYSAVKGCIYKNESLIKKMPTHSNEIEQINVFYKQLLEEIINKAKAKGITEDEMLNHIVI